MLILTFPISDFSQTKICKGAPKSNVLALFIGRSALKNKKCIARFVAKKCGLAGKTEEDFAHADMILEHCVDFLKGMTNMLMVDIRFQK